MADKGAKKITEHSLRLAEAMTKLRMDHKQWTRHDLSKASGVSRHSITSIEEGKSQPTTKTLMKLAYALGVSCASIFKYVEDGYLDVSDGDSVVGGDEMNSDGGGADADFEKALFKLRRKSQGNPHLRSTVMELSKLQTVYQKQPAKEKEH